MKVQIHCPFCEETYDLDEFPEGAHTKCEKCGQEFVIDMSVVGPGAKQAKPASPQPPKAASPAIPAPPPPPVTSTPPPVASSSKVALGLEAPPRKFDPPLLATLFQVIAFLSGIVSVFMLVVVLSNRGGNGTLFPFLGLLLNTFMTWGCAEIITHISEIRFHAIRQTELLEIIAGKSDKK